MKKLILILLFSLLLPNVTNNGAEVSISENVTVNITGDLILNSGNINVSGYLYVSGDIIQDGGTFSGNGYINDTPISLGDLNSDANIDILDIIILVQIIAFSDEYNELGDINGDGTLNILDAVALVQIVLTN